MQDTEKLITKNKQKPHPKGMRYNPLVIKWSCMIASKCHKKGYDVVRNIIPIPTWETIKQYRQAPSSTNPISQENLTLMVQEMTRRGCKGIGGIHWDEMAIKEGIVLSKRTGELVGFEDLNISVDLTMRPEDLDDNDQENNDSSSESTDSDSVSDESDQEYDSNPETALPSETEASSSKKAKLVCQFFFSSLEGDFSWPVASYPLHKINHQILSSLVWQVCEAIGSLRLDNGNRIEILYGVCDGSTYSHAFFSRAGVQNWVTYNPFNDNKPIWWLSDYPHMIKKLRNFIVNPDGQLKVQGKRVTANHLIPVVQRQMTKLNWKHIKLTPRTKMSVKRAVAVCSLDVALDILKGPIPPEETVGTRTYLKQCYKLFKLFNNNSEVDPACYKQLISIMFWFDNWYGKVKQNSSQARSGLKDHWKQFIPRITYKDLKRSIRAFLGVVQYVQMHHPEIHIVPKTMCQDDVENYFSLQRARVSGGKPTTLQFFESSASLETELLLTSEMKDLQGNCGSYDLAALPNLVSLPLSKQKLSSDDSTKHFSEKEGWEACAHLLSTDSVIEERWGFDETFHNVADKEQLSRHVKQTVEYIDLFSPTTILRTLQPILTALHARENHHHVLFFARKLDYYLRTQFFTGKWSPFSLQAALEKLKGESALCFYWRELLQKLHCSNPQISLSCDVLSGFVRKFSKRRCVTYLAKDGLSPQHEEDESAIRQMLKKFHIKQDAGMDLKKAQPSDECFRCHKLGHWAAECPEGHEPEWLAKQKCFLCGQEGHIKSTCPKKSDKQQQLKSKIKQNQPPIVKRTWYPDSTSLAKLLSTLTAKSLGDFKCYEPIPTSPSTNDDPIYYKQRSVKWFNARKAKINGSKAATTLGWYGKKAMLDYWNQLFSDLHGLQTESSESNLAMLWGSINEDSALVTYLKNFFSHNKGKAVVKETGIWFLKDENNQNWLGSSPDAIIEEDGILKTVIEIKCPYMGGKPVPYKNVCVNHIPQIMLEMFCTSTQQCHYVVWTPVGTKVFLVERDNEYLKLLLNYLYKFWDLASSGTEPAWHEDVFGLKQKSKEISLKSPCICFITNSIITPNVMTHEDLKKFANVANDKPLKQKTLTRKCQGCKDEEWKCKLNPCETRRKRTSNASGSNYQSYKYGSNGIHNSCHQDTFLELTYHAVKRHLNCPSNSNLGEGLKQLLDAFVLRENEKFHESKMKLWRWLRDSTTNGHTYYAYGKEASLNSIIYRILETMPDEIKDRFSIKVNYSKACSANGGHNSCGNFTYSVFPISTDDVLDTHKLLDLQEFDVIEVIKHKLTLDNFVGSSKCSVLVDDNAMFTSTTNSDCAIIPNPITCDAVLQQSTIVINKPDVFFVEYTHNTTKKCTPALNKECIIKINNCTYRLSGIVYLKSHHYWCEVYSTQNKCKSGWYVHNGLWNNGKATFVGPRPLFMEKETLHLLMFEKLITSANNPVFSTTFYKPVDSDANNIIKDIIHKHKDLLSLSDNKVKLENIKAILLYHNISVLPNMKLADLKDLLLQHCNTSVTVPITFVSDCSIEKYTVASEMEQSSKHEQSKCIPVTFISDSIVDLVKTQGPKNDKYCETESLKRLELTPNKQGYTPERHPTKKQKPNFARWTNEILTTEKPKSKSFKEMIDALHKSIYNTSDSDDDFDQAFQPLNTDIYFDTLNEPSEREKQCMEVKSYISDSFDYSHEFQMVRTQDLWEYKEFDRSLTPKYGNDHDHLEQVRRFILKNGFQEPIIISCDLKTGKAYITEGNHRLWVALKEGITYIPCRVIPHWLSPSGSYKILDIDFSNLQSKEIILPEDLGLTVAHTAESVKI